MKLAHINIIFSKGRMSGVEKKLIDEAEAMKLYNIDMFILNREKECYENNIYYINIDKYFYNNFFMEIYIRSFKYNIIDKCINLSNYDKFILRYSLIDFSAFSFSKKYKNKIITEHHTKELNEIKVQNIKEPFKTFQYFLEKYFAKYFFYNVYGVIGVSSDIIYSIKERVQMPSLKSYILSNGISKANLKNTQYIQKDILSIDLLFVASRFQDWHGFERLINSLSQYNSTKKIKLHLVGILNNEQKKIILNFTNSLVEIFEYGKLSQNELSKLYNISNIACDSLSMYKLDMYESSTLKSKEYVLNYIPFLYSAPDPDFKNINKYLFDCKNDDSLIDFERIIDNYLKINFNNLKKDFDECKVNVLSWNLKILNLKKWVSNAKL